MACAKCAEHLLSAASVIRERLRQGAHETLLPGVDWPEVIDTLVRQAAAIQHTESADGGD